MHKSAHACKITHKLVVTFSACVAQQILKKFVLQIHYYIRNISLKFDKDPSFLSEIFTKQAGAELGQAQLPIGIGFYCD